MKRRIIITQDKHGICEVRTLGKFRDGDYADILAGAYSRAVVDTMREHNLTSEKVAEIAIYAIRKNIEEMRKRDNQ